MDSTRKRDIDANLTAKIIACAIDVHKEMGPGLLESVYEECLCYELGKRGHKVQRQKEVSLRYKELELQEKLRLDILVDDRCIVEVKSVENLLLVHRAQLLSYLRLTGCRVGLLLNFNEALIKDGICRVINDRWVLPTV